MSKDTNNILGRTFTPCCCDMEHGW